MNPTRHSPVISPESNIREFIARAVILGVFMAMSMAAADAYPALKAGMTIAATWVYNGVFPG